jgi:glycosyltransferase involved in cell wall biosynthesis
VKILIDNQVYENQSFGGISRYFNELQRGNEVIERMELFKYQPPVKKSFYKRLQLKLKPSTVIARKGYANKYDFYNTQLQDREYDLFHPTYYDTYFLKELKKPFVLTVHDMIHEKYAEYFGPSPDSINKRRLCEAADKIIAISQSTKKDIIDIFGTSEDKIEVIYHATNFDSIQVSKPEFIFSENKYLLFTGSRSAYKNFLTFLIAVAPLLRENKNLILVCTGPELNEIENRWIKDLDLEESVQHYYCNNDNELLHLYQNAECFIFPSLYEGFGLPLLEAFASGCPVVSSPGGSLKEIAGNAAVYFDPKDIKSIRNSIQNVISDSTLKLDLIEAGKIRLKDFSWEKCRKETMDLYAKVI